MNVSKSARLIESIKSIILVVLFLLTILLLYFFWSDTAPGTPAREVQPGQLAVEPIDIFRPDRMEISFGGGGHTITNYNFDLMMDSFRVFSEGRSLIVEEISRELYQEMLSRASIRATFEYYIPFSAIRELHGLDRISGADNIGAVSELAYVASFDDRLFIRDRKAGQYFRIIGTSTEYFAHLRQAIVNVPRIQLYFTLGSQVGRGIENNTLWPVPAESNLHDITYFREDFLIRESEIVSVARSFFSDNFDFVRRIVEANGTVIYMYGYGETVVIVRQNGVLEFISRNTNRTNVQLSYLEAFEVANAFIAKHGGFSTVTGMALTPYIREVSVISEDGQRGFRFIFGIEIGSSRIYFQRGEAMIVDVIGDNVSYFRRQLLNVDLHEVEAAQRENRRILFSLLNLIAYNTEYIGNVLLNTQRVRAEDLFLHMHDDLIAQTIFQKVTRLDSGYVKIEEDENILRAAWIVMIAGLEFYFGIDDGKPLGHRLKY